MEDNSIKVEGVVLREFIKDNELVKDQVEREKLVAENTTVAAVYHKPQAKYRRYQEDNGEVKILTKREINQSVYEQELTKFLAREQMLFSVVTVLVCGPDIGYVRPSYISNEMERVARKNNIPLVGHPKSAVRWHLRNVSTSMLSEHISILGGRMRQYKLKDSSANLLSLLDAIKLSKVKKHKEVRKAAANTVREPLVSPQLTEDTPSVPATPPKPKDDTIKTDIKATIEQKILDDVVSKAKDLGQVLKVEGDLHIHIHININTG